MLLSRMAIAKMFQDEGQNGHSGTIAAGDSPHGNITVSLGETLRRDSGGDIDLREPQAQRNDGYGRETGNGVGPGIDAHQETGQEGQVKHG